jgi:hypothetical protein
LKLVEEHAALEGLDDVVGDAQGEAQRLVLHDGQDDDRDRTQFGIAF